MLCLQNKVFRYENNWKLQKNDVSEFRFKFFVFIVTHIFYRSVCSARTSLTLLSIFTGLGQTGLKSKQTIE